MKRWKLIRARIIANLSVTDVANLTGISDTHYRQIEAGIRNPSLNTVYAIMKVLNNSDISLFRDRGGE